MTGATVKVTYDTPTGYERSHRSASVKLSEHSAKLVESLMIRLALADEEFDFDNK